MSNYEELIRPEFEVQCKKLGRGIERGVHSGEYASLPTYDAWEALKSATSPLLAALEEKDQQLARYSMSAGQADQRLCESRAVRIALGFGEDAIDVAPTDLVGAIQAIRNVAVAAEKSLIASREVVALYDERLKEAEQRTEASGRREEHLKATVDVLSAKNAELERITEGVDQLAIDGGWTARGMSEYAKARDAENQDLMLTVGRLRTERTELEQRLQQPIAIPAGFRIVPIKATREQLAAVQVAGKSVVYTDMVLAAPEHPGFTVEGE